MLGDNCPSNDCPDELARLPEENFYAMFHGMTQALAGEWEESAQISRFYSWPDNPIFKGVFRTRLAPEDADATIEETIAWFRARRASSFFWWTDKEMQPSDLADRLRAHGLFLLDKDSAAMVAELDRIPFDEVSRPGLSVSLVETENQLLQWKQVFNQSFGVPEHAGQAWIEATRAAGLGQAPWKLLLGTINGEAIGSGLLFFGAGVAGLHGLAILPAYRGRGLGKSLQRERLRMAYQWGYRYAVTIVAPSAYATTRRSGFQDTGRRLSCYFGAACS